MRSYSEKTTGMAGFTDRPDRQSNSVCRDFLRNVCTRGAKCKFSHDEEFAEFDRSNKMQDTLVFCHDYQNYQSCNRPNCKFIHCKKEEEEVYKRSGYMPPNMREQAIQKGVAPDSPIVTGNRPICKDFLINGCRRTLCKFRHVSPQQYDLEIAEVLETQRGEDNQYKPNRSHEVSLCAKETFSKGYRAYGVFHEEPVEKRRRMQHVCFDTNYHSGGGGGGHMDAESINHENFLLRQELQDLKKELSDLVTTNNFLLEQNAQLRMSLKAAAVEAIVPNVSQCDGSIGSSNQPPVVSMAVPVPTATVAPQGATITMTMAVPPSSMAPAPISMSLPVAQLQTTISGSPLVTTITMAPPQPTGTLVTSMSLGPTLEATQPLVTSINLATAPIESGQIQAAPGLTLQALSTPVSTMPAIHAVSQAIQPPQTMTLAPNSVQVHETRLVSYPIMSVRHRV